MQTFKYWEVFHNLQTPNYFKQSPSCSKPNCHYFEALHGKSILYLEMIERPMRSGLEQLSKIINKFVLSGTHPALVLQKLSTLTVNKL